MNRVREANVANIGDRIVLKRADGNYDVLVVETEGWRTARAEIPTLEQARDISLSDLPAGGRRWYAHHSNPEQLEPLA